MIEIDGHAHEARISDGIFQSVEGDLVVSAGSSGWMRPNGSPARFVEISLRGSSASRLFKRPKGGSKITWRAI